jgi:hypothetical protein
MNDRLLHAALLAAFVAAMPSLAAAQFPPPPPPPVQDRWPQQQQPQQSRPSQTQQQPAQQPPAPQADTAAKPKPKPAAPANVVTCGGTFARDTTHLKLAIKYDSRNIVFGEVDGPDGSRIKATVLFPNDPKRRLEIIWNNDAARTDMSLIVINGQSQWTAPKGLKLGTPLAALEKANGRPFKLSGFGPDGTASVTGWEGGALTSLPGGCKVGVRLLPDRKVSEDARGAVAGDKPLLSNDASLRAVKPTIGEILIGY